MRVLLLHPEDDFNGSWKKERWDRVVDLGRAPRSFYEERSGEFGCPVSSIYDLALETMDVRIWRELFAIGMGRVVDRFGLDWWDIIGLLLQEKMQDVRLAARLAKKIGEDSSLTASRSSLVASAVQLQLGTRMRVLQSGLDARWRNRASRYRAALRNLSLDQLRQVAYDKFDPHYGWRRRFARGVERRPGPVVLLPTAYSNVTRTALNYARCLPEQKFLLVVARESAAALEVPANVQMVSLAAFANGRSDPQEMGELESRWVELEGLLEKHPEFSLPVRLGIVRSGIESLRRGISVRDAWNQVFKNFAVTGCLCADDTNPYTRIPLILAKRHEIAAVACHHGALDSRMGFKVPEFSTYLAQGEMERDYLENACGVDGSRIRIGAAGARERLGRLWSDDAPRIVFFTEPYETDFWRTRAIYREVLPRLCDAARQCGKTVLLKLHPFETVTQRKRLVEEILGKDLQGIKITAAPISIEMLRSAWCAVTVESTVASECAAAGIPAFLCGWLRHAYCGYMEQFARFGVGRILESANDLLRIPELVPSTRPGSDVATLLSQSITADVLAEALSTPVVHPDGVAGAIQISSIA
ncbi:MAG TPA: hypothetical protein VMT67_15705 [Terriglobales bacterium]|nr:hypothetical protein [Terriglobales bacterium]